MWNQEASYYYYKHGPLARVELGAYRSQGQDYYYTLQGWIKGVNQPYGDQNAYDNNVGKDVYAYALGYYENDYKPINSSLTTTDTRDQLWSRLNESHNHKGLYNGNISWMVTDLTKIGEVTNDRSKGIQAMLYKYDQLHRITKSRSLTSYTEGTGFAARTATPAPYDETYTYDANGNILTLNRMNGEGALMDDFSYKYYGGTNKLRGVKPITRDTIFNGTVNSPDKLYRNMTLQGGALAANGNSATLKATELVAMNPSFAAEEGTDFAAYIPEEGPYIYDAIGNLVADEDEGVKISWTPYGKIREVKTNNDSVTVKFRYDGTGNRIEKRVEKYDTTLITRYVRDASGNVMTIYNDTTVSEQPIYGSARLGMYRGGVLDAHRILGRRSYELSNHLGNVLAVITDNIGMNTQDTVWASVESSGDYYAFGMMMPGRSYSGGSYRYGFNGKEKDDKGELGETHYDYGFRIYNPRIAKFLSVDPLTKSYPELTPYQFASNRPIDGIDLDGLEYLRAEEARVEFTRGELLLKVENFIRVNKNAWYYANSNRKNWAHGEYGISRKVGNISVTVPQYSKGDLKDIPGDQLPSSAKNHLEDGIKSEGGSMVSVPQGRGGQTLSKGAAILDFINLGLEQYMTWAWKYDKDKIDEHKEVANKVSQDITVALRNGLIPEKYQNTESVTNIMNVVLQGVNNTSDQGIYDVGMQIYNTISRPLKEIQSVIPKGADNTRVEKTFVIPKQLSSSE